MNVRIEWSLNPRRTLCVLASVMLLLVICHVLAMQANFNESLGIKRALGFEYWQVALFDLDEEESFGTWFSAVNLLFAGLLSLYLAARGGAAHAAMRYWWIALGLGLMLMSIDEVVGMHEQVNTVFDETVWTTMSLVIVFASGIGFIPFLWYYRGRTALWFVLGGMLFVGGAVGLEHYMGDDVNSLRYNMLTAAEEGLEMLGVILAIYAMLELMSLDNEAR